MEPHKNSPLQEEAQIYGKKPFPQRCSLAAPNANRRYLFLLQGWVWKC